MSKIPREFVCRFLPKNTGHNKPEEEHRKENIPRLENYAGTTRYGHEAELREQNQNLRITNEDLQKSLTQTQEKVTALEQQYSELKKDKLETEKHLKDCHALLVSAQIDPVLGEKVGEAVREDEEHRKEVMTVSTELLNELKSFADTAQSTAADYSTTHH
ncbi:hypothetical protein WMY93_015575 [Mugilogobius chulae]|uniref:Kinetochore localized astrin (SPAG5) binding protein n=1 Tax=Mugilogobius chulae TaxID=88201 RepID=A0AAW0NUV9_9GOBI